MSALPARWSVAKIEDLFATLEDGRTLHQGWSPQCERVPSKTDKEWGVLRTTAIQPAAFMPEQNKRLPSHLTPRPQLEVRPGDLLVTCAGPRARCGISCLVRNTRPRLMMSGKMYRFRVPEQSVAARYVEYFLQSAEARLAIDQMKTGGSDSGLNLTHDRFRQLRVPLAPRPEQERIVAAIEEQFTRLDAGVAALESLGRNIKRMRAAVLEEAVTGVLLDDARVTERGALTAFGVQKGELPTYWRWAELGDFVVKGPQNGLYLPASQYGRGTAILRIADFQDGWAQHRDALQLVAARADDVTAFALEAGDIVINRVNSMTHLGKCLVVTPSLAGAVFESNMMRLQTSDELMGEYLALYLRSDRGRSLLLKNAKQAVNQASINQNDVRRCRIAVPPLHEQKAIISMFETVSAALSNIAGVSRATDGRAHNLRSSILAAAFSGALALQDPQDEPASVLLERVAAERASSNGHQTARGTRRDKVLA